ncbi:unnamed protein product [Arabis nemorensis]|uniref:Pectinesterase inhibitor domain-containing protein n=1 Tax=Arabis nemorensis TaxID=586526 RepID=A0A565B6J6_9BRAS|nr:unnamed protein product [Arabis nemorensis]
MESNTTFWIIMIVMILTPLESKCVPIRDSFVARSLLSVSPPCESESLSPAPAPAPEVTEPINTPANPPSDIDSPASSPDTPADSILPADSASDIELSDSPSSSPEAPADSIPPANSPSEISPASSPETPAGSISPSESDLDSPASSPDSPAGSIPPTNPPSQENPMAPSGKTLMNSPKNLLNPPLLSPEIKTICGKTDNPPLCESSVTPLLTPDFKPDTSSVLILLIQASINATKAAKVTVDKAAAADCQELYDDAVTNLEDVISAVKSRDYPTVNTNLSAAMTDYGTCNDGFEESGEPNPLADVSEKLTKMVSNCLALSTLLK